MIYLIGSLRNPEVPLLAAYLRAATGLEVFDSWYAAGPHADDHWRDYEQARGHNLEQALQGYAARHIVAFDREHLHRASCVVLIMPAGKSGHLEFGYAVGRGTRGFVYLADDPERFDVMYGLEPGCPVVVYTKAELAGAILAAHGREGGCYA